MSTATRTEPTLDAKAMVEWFETQLDADELDIQAGRLPSMLAYDIEAKREIIRIFRQSCVRPSDEEMRATRVDVLAARYEHEATLERVIRLLAWAYSGRPGYLERWRPS